MKITLKTAMYISRTIKEIEKDKYGNEAMKKRRKLRKYIEKLTDDEWLQLKKQFLKPFAF